MITREARKALLAEASRRSGVVVDRRCPMGDLSARIIAACAEPLRFSRLCAAVDRRPRTINTTLRRLVASGRVQRIARGVYVSPGDDR